MTIKESQPDPDSSLAAWLAYDLRFYRRKYDLSQGQLSKIIGRSPASISNCESGRRMINEDEADILDKRWDTGGHFRRLLTFARRNHNPDWFREHLSFEVKATMIRTYEGLLVPGLLQTPEYARASFEASGLENLDLEVEKRLQRREIFQRRDPPFLEVLLDQAVLLRRVGGTKIMKGQLQELATISEDPQVILRVIPLAEGAHMGLDGGFTSLVTEVGEVGFVEAPIGGRLVTERSEVRSLTLRWARIGAKALPEGPSRDLIHESMETME